VFAVCVVIFAHKMKPPAQNPAAALDGGIPIRLAGREEFRNLTTLA
jgi:hypothetical protein